MHVAIQDSLVELKVTVIEIIVDSTLIVCVTIAGLFQSEDSIENTLIFIILTPSLDVAELIYQILFSHLIFFAFRGVLGVVNDSSNFKSEAFGIWILFRPLFKLTFGLFEGKVTVLTTKFVHEIISGTLGFFFLGNLKIVLPFASLI